MEEVEAGLLEGRIEWLAETILETLDTDKLDSWIRQVGLADDIEKLRSEIERVEAVVAAVKGNKPLFRSLGRVREVLYDADDAVDELNYDRLQQQVHGQGVIWHEHEDTAGDGTEHEGDGPTNNANVSEGSGTRKRRSKAWGHFTAVEHTKEKDPKPIKARCNYCGQIIRCGSKNGTSALLNHLDICKKNPTASDQPPNLPSAGDVAPNGNSVASGNSVGRKRRRANEESTVHVAANSRNKTNFSNSIKQITCHLQHALKNVLRLDGSDSFASPNVCRSTTSDSHLMTSTVVPNKMFGRVAEKNSIIKLMTEDSDDVMVLPIVGIGGIGKTALAQLIYNDQNVKNSFQQRIWVSVSNNINEMRITREMLGAVCEEKNVLIRRDMIDDVCTEKHEPFCSFSKLQEILMSHMKSKRFLLILDDVWHGMNNCRLNKLLAPLKSNNAKGNVILVTTRIWSVAKRMGTIEPIKLGALEKEDSWLLFKSCAFGDENHEPCGSLSAIGQKLTDKLKGNPLAIETTGELLSEHHTVDHWNEILKNEEWKSLQLSGGIMPSLKRSYDQLPYHLQQCFLYCSIFPSSYKFCSEDLVRIWISQGFVRGRHSNKRLEEIGEGCLTLLVNLGFFQQAEREESCPKNQTCYAMCGLMHDFARLISRSDCATIDGVECTEIRPTTRHLSILTDSAFRKDKDGNILHNKRFEERLKSVATSANKLRTLVLIGKYASFLFQSIIRVFQKAHNLRMLHIDAEYADFNSFLCEMVNHTHFRYIKLRAVQKDGALTQLLSKFYHLQVLDVGSDNNPTIFSGINNLVSLRHLVVQKGVCSSVASIGKMTSLQELHDFSVQNCSNLEIAQLQSMNGLVYLGVSQLEKVRSQQEACGASLKDKQHLQKLHLSWRDAKDEYDTDMSYKNKYDSDMISEPSMDIEKEAERLQMIDTDGSPSLEHSPDIASEVLEGLEPHHNLKHLRIFEYNGSTSPTWLASSLTCLQTLHLENCGKWQRLPLERLWLLTKLVLIKMGNATEVSIPSLEELVLIELPRLKTCSCISVRELNSSLRVLMIKRCHALEVFPMFENCQQFKIEQSSWLSHLSKLTIHDCPCLHVHNPLPPSTIVSKLSITRVSTLPTFQGSSREMLTIGPPDDGDDILDEHSDQLIALDDKVLSFYNLRLLTKLEISGCQNLTALSFEGLSQLICLKKLRIYNCRKLLSSNVPSEVTSEDTAGANRITLPSLESLDIAWCGITGKWLSLMLQHVQTLQKLSLYECEQITGLSTGEDENSRSNHMSAMDAQSLGYPSRDRLLHLPLNLIPTLKKVSIACLVLHGIKEGFAGLTSLEELQIMGIPYLDSHLAYNDGNDKQANGRYFLPLSLGELTIRSVCSLKTLQLCFPGNFTCLKKLHVLQNPSLTSLQLHSCTTLEELTIKLCESLATLEGLPSLCSLRHLVLKGCPRLPPCLESLSGQCYELCPRLESLEIDDPSILTTLFCKHLTSLQRLEFSYCGREVTRLTNEQESGLQLLTSLQELLFMYCHNLEDLPTGLHRLPSLKRLDISFCRTIERLPEKGLPPSLEELDISLCTKELDDQCRTLASKLKVKINGDYVN